MIWTMILLLKEGLGFEVWNNITDDGCVTIIGTLSEEPGVLGMLHLRCIFVLTFLSPIPMVSQFLIAMCQFSQLYHMQFP